MSNATNNAPDALRAALVLAAADLRAMHLAGSMRLGSRGVLRTVRVIGELSRNDEGRALDVIVARLVAAGFQAHHRALEVMACAPADLLAA